MRFSMFGAAPPLVLSSLLILNGAIASSANEPSSPAPGTGRSTGVASSNESPSAALARGKQLLQKKQYAMAVAACTAALNKDETLKQAYMLRGDCEQHLKKYSDAAADYSRYSLLSPNNVAGYLRVSNAYACLGKDNLALSYLCKAVVLDPRDASIYTARAALYDKLGKHAMAIDDRTVATALVHARTQPGKGKVVLTTPPVASKASKVASSQQGLARNGQQSAPGNAGTLSQSPGSLTKETRTPSP